ncbi:hypothetical protein ISCGN_023574 [Ixodes scapularis]
MKTVISSAFSSGHGGHVLSASNEMQTSERLAFGTCCAFWNPLETDKTTGWSVQCCEGVRPTLMSFTVAQHNPSFEEAQDLPTATRSAVRISFEADSTYIEGNAPSDLLGFLAYAGWQSAQRACQRYYSCNIREAGGSKTRIVTLSFAFSDRHLSACSL